MDYSDFYKFNLNDYFLVKLTEKGYEHWEREWNSVYRSLGVLDKIQPISYFKNKADKNGYVSFQAHEFMQIFGKTIDPSLRPIFETGILIRKSELKDVK